MIAVLCGGVGAARLLRALAGVHDAGDTVAIVNVGDDLVLHGLSICPDLDTIMYTLAGRNDDAQGWGLAGESWRVMDALGALGGATWFRLGDLDLATHLFRTQRLAEGATKQEVTAELCERFGVRQRLVPVTNDDVRTRVSTPDGDLSFQEYFVARRHDVEVTAVAFDGAAASAPATGVLEAIATAERVVIAPSNPIVSIDPVLAVPGVRSALVARRADVVAVSPIVAGVALKGPADRLMADLGLESSCVGIAAHLRDVAGTLVIDEADAGEAPRVRALGVAARVTTTVMSDPRQAERLAKEVLS